MEVRGRDSINTMCNVHSVLDDHVYSVYTVYTQCILYTMMHNFVNAEFSGYHLNLNFDTN